MNGRTIFSSHWRRAAGAAAVLAALAVTLTACGGTPSDPGPSIGGAGGSSTPATSGGGTAPAAHATTAPARHTSTRASTASRCTLPTVEAIAGESSSADARRTAGWSLLQANGWTVFAPNGSWHLSASQGGADVLSPDGQSDASVANWPAQTPWTFATLGQQILAHVSNISVICQSPVERNSQAQTQATEFTGNYQGEHIHAVVILSLFTPTTPGLYNGQTRSFYTPVAQWSPAAATTLMLIIKRAILSPSQP
jgi:hypothetical protein